MRHRSWRYRSSSNIADGSALFIFRSLTAAVRLRESADSVSIACMYAQHTLASVVNVCDDFACEEGVIAARSPNAKDGRALTLGCRSGANTPEGSMTSLIIICWTPSITTDVAVNEQPAVPMPH